MSQQNHAISHLLQTLEADGFKAEFKVTKRGGQWSAAIVEGFGITNDPQPLLDSNGEVFLQGFGITIDEAIEVLNSKVLAGMLTSMAETFEEPDPESAAILRLAALALNP